VSRAARLSLPEAQENVQAGLMVFMIAEEGWEENRGIEEGLDCSLPKAAR